MDKTDIVQLIQNFIAEEIKEMYPNMSDNRIREYIIEGLKQKAIHKTIVYFICNCEVRKRENS